MAKAPLRFATSCDNLRTLMPTDTDTIIGTLILTVEQANDWRVWCACPGTRGRKFILHLDPAEQPEFWRLDGGTYYREPGEMAELHAALLRHVWRDVLGNEGEPRKGRVRLRKNVVVGDMEMGEATVEQHDCGHATLVAFGAERHRVNERSECAVPPSGEPATQQREYDRFRTRWEIQASPASAAITYLESPDA